jgi:hypothetical protein
MLFHFNPACFRMLFKVPGAKSSLGLPATVTRIGSTMAAARLRLSDLPGVQIRQGKYEIEVVPV